MRLLLALFIGLAPLTWAERFSSEPGQVSMLELYTSQGCSSCPPADAWLSKLVDHPRLWSQMIPLAFHVDYWNRLGWRDPFGAAKYTRRQYDFRRAGKSRAVYTPGFFLNGGEWRARTFQAALDAPRLAGGRLEVIVDRGEVEVRYPEENRVVHLALLGFGHETAVGAGENRRRTLQEDFVVLDWRSHHSERTTWRGAMPESDQSSERRALVVWISEPDSPVPLQATGGWLQP